MQELEGAGAQQVHFVDMRELAAALPPPPRATLPRRLAATMGVGFRGLPYLLGLRKPRRGGTPA